MIGQLANIDLVILFFFLGMIGSWARSDLEIPEPVSKFLSIFLLLSLGLKGGHEVRATENLSGFGFTLAIGLLACLVIPLYLFHWLKRNIGPANAAALAASYGSVSAVTFIAAQGYLTNEGTLFSGYMVAVMALMEMPAIIVALLVYREANGAATAKGGLDWSVFSAKSVVLLGGGFLIGLLMNEPSWNSIAPVVKDSFKGFLAFFLLDLGVQAYRQLHRAWQFKWRALLLGIGLPLLHGSLTLLVARLIGINPGDSILIASLVGSASYIAAPAAVRQSIPDANPGLYVSLPLALTFPMNVLFGIPLYIEIGKLLN